MTQKVAARLAWGLWGLTLAISAAALVAWVLSLDTPTQAYGFRGVALLHAMAFATAGALIASRRSTHPLGWIFCAVGALIAVQELGYEYAVYALEHAAVAELARVGAWIVNWIWVVWIFGVGMFGLLLYPDGRLPSRRWRPVAWFDGVAIVMLGVTSAFKQGTLDNVREYTNPFGFLRGTTFEVLDTLGILLAMTGIVLSVASIVVRMRRARPEERLQLRWFLLAGAVLVVGLGTNVFENVLSDKVIGSSVLAALALFPVALGIGILKYRAFDLDVVISKAVVYGILLVIITLDYLAIVVGIGTLVGDRASPVLTAAAAAIAALSFQPINRRLTRFANRLVYGKRATPYEVLSEFSERVGTAYSTEDVLPRMARLIVEGTGATRGDVWLRIGDTWRLEASWPAEAPTLSAPDDDEGRPFEVRHQGQTLGALSLVKPANDPVTPAEERLLGDLAAQAGLVLRNVRLLEDLRASRRRLVTAQNDERRRLERDIHDGAQQHLVALMVKLRVLEALAKKNPARVAGAVEELKGQAQDALETLRDLARGIYPPVLADRGLAAALEAQTRGGPVPVAISPDGVGRLPQEVEAAVYFCVLEALQNVAKYAGASGVDLTLRQIDGQVEFEVRDDGRGFDPDTTPRGSGLQNMADRLEALGGTLVVTSAPGGGTTVVGRVPAEALR